MSTSAMRASTRFLRVDVFVEVLRRPEVDQLDGCVDAADTVNAAEALDDAHGIPVDVVVDEVIAVLKVLAFGDAVGGDEQVNLAVLRHGWNLVAVLGTRRKVGEDLVEVALAEGGVVVSAAGDQRDVDAQFFVRPIVQRVEQVSGGVGKGGEDEDFAVGLPELVGGGVFDLVVDELLQLSSLASRSAVTSLAAR